MIPTPRTDALEFRADTTIHDDIEALWHLIDDIIESHGRIERELAAMTVLNREHVRQLNERTSDLGPA